MHVLRAWRTENSVKSIAKRMENGSPEVLCGLHHRFNSRLEAPPGGFRIKVRYQACRAHNVGKQCRGLLPFAL